MHGHVVKKENGFTLAEVVVYVSILTLALVTVILAISGVARVYTHTQAQQRIGRAAAFSLSRMMYEIRRADVADTVYSTFGTHPGVLTLLSSNPTQTSRVYVENGVLKIDESGSYAGDLTPEKVYVSSFVVTHIQVDSSSAIRVELTLDSPSRNGTTTRTFETTAVMRGSYTK